MKETRGGREEVIGGLSAQKDEIDLVRVRETGVKESAARGGREIDGGFAIGGYGTFHNAELSFKLLFRPFGKSLDQFGVIETFFWQICGDRRDLRYFHNASQGVRIRETKSVTRERASKRRGIKTQKTRALLRARVFARYFRAAAQSPKNSFSSSKP